MRFDRFHRLATIGTVLLGLSALFLSGEFGLAVVVPAIAVSLAGPFFWRSLDRPWLGPASGGVALVAGVVALLWGKSTKRWVHLLNYRDEPCEATVTLPGCGGRKLDAYSPDEAPLAVQVVDSGPACVTFVISGIQTYAVVEVT